MNKLILPLISILIFLSLGFLVVITDNESGQRNFSEFAFLATFATFAPDIVSDLFKVFDEFGRN